MFYIVSDQSLVQYINRLITRLINYSIVWDQSFYLHLLVDQFLIIISGVGWVLNFKFSKMGRTFGMVHYNYLQEAKHRNTKMYTSEPLIQIRALNSSAVFDATPEEGRLFHKGIVLGKKEFFRASLLAIYLVYCES